MIDWIRNTREFRMATTLSGEDLDAYLAELETASPEVRTKLREEAHKSDVGASAAGHFMQTSAGDVPVARPALPPRTQIGQWRIIDHIGSGGMGEVYRAERADGLYEHTVALKVIDDTGAARAERFRQEREWLARLDHRGVARIVDGGTAEDGRPFMAMEFVDGLPLLDYARERRLGFRAKIELIAELSAAVAHAHGRLVLHRDIKPDNVVVDKGGTPRLIDFGIASLLDDEEEKGGGAMTIAYAAPEQLRREPASVGTDIFALGIVMHQLLTGRAPQREADGSVSIDAGAIDDPDVTAILHRATALAGDDRYPSVDAFSDDLEAFLAGGPVEARGGGRGYRLRKLVSRYPFATGLAALAVLALAGGLIVSLILADRARDEADRANEALARAEWSLDRSDIYNQAQSAYADTLQRMFGGDADVERLTEILKSRWREAFDARAEDPENAAYLSFAIGRHFLFRNDYPTAIEIVEPWVNEKFGPPDLQLFGEQVLAIAYMNGGQEADAIPLLRGIKLEYASGYDAYSPDHAASASQLALATNETADLRDAERVIMRTIDSVDDPNVIIFFWNQMAAIRRGLGDLTGAHEAMRRAVRLVNDSPLSEISGQDTARLNLTEYELFLTRDLDAAQRLAAQVIEDSEQRGASRELGRAYLVQAEIAARRGNYARAEARLAEAIPLIERFAGEDARYYMDGYALLAEVKAAQGKYTAARQALADGGFTEGGDNAVRLRLADLYVTRLSRGASAASARAQDESWAGTRISDAPDLLYIYDRLRRIGIDLPPPGETS